MGPETLGYLARLIDADGHVTWRGGKYQAPDVGVTNTSYELMQWLEQLAGGSVAAQRYDCPVDCAEPHRHRRATVWKWHLTGERACILLRAIRPYMRIKGARADAVVRQYEAHLAVMERPARRRHHVAKERAAMTERGWD